MHESAILFLNLIDFTVLSVNGPMLNLCASQILYSASVNFVAFLPEKELVKAPLLVAVN